MTPKGKKRKKGIPQEDAAAVPLERGMSQRRVVVTVVCEGKTEHGYLKQVNSELGQESRYVIQLDPGSQPDGGFKPSEVVERAVAARKRSASRKDPNVWAVFDRDDHHDIPEAERNARKNGINVAYSTPSFDLWLWLHFAPGKPPLMSRANRQLVDNLNSVPGFEHYGKSSGGRSSGSKPKVLNDRQLTTLWEKRGNAVGLARALVDGCSSSQCKARPDKRGEPGHAPNCALLRRNTQTDFYRLLELVGVADHPSPAKRG